MCCSCANPISFAFLFISWLLFCQLRALSSVLCCLVGVLPSATFNVQCPPFNVQVPLQFSSRCSQKILDFGSVSGINYQPQDWDLSGYSHNVAAYANNQRKMPKMASISTGQGLGNGSVFFFLGTKSQVSHAEATKNPLKKGH